MTPFHIPNPWGDLKHRLRQQRGIQSPCLCGRDEWCSWWLSEGYKEQFQLYPEVKRDAVTGRDFSEWVLLIARHQHHLKLGWRGCLLSNAVSLYSSCHPESDFIYRERKYK